MPNIKRQPIELTETGVPLELLEVTEATPLFRMGIVGRSGVGKTFLAATAQWVTDMSPVLLIDCGESADTVLGEEMFAGLKVLRVRSMAEMQAVYNWLAPANLFAGGQGAVEQFKTIIVDESDELHLSYMRPLMEEAHRKDPSKYEEDVASQRDWGKARNKMLQLFDWFRVLPVHLIFTYVPYVKKNEVTGIEQVTIGLAGKLSDDLAKRFGIVAYLDVTEKTYRVDGQMVTTATRKLLFNAISRVLTKVRGPSRADRLGAELSDPTMQKIYDAWFNVGVLA